MSNETTERSALRVREATVADIPRISEILQQLTRLGKRTRPSDEDFVRSNYVEHREHIRCSVAIDEDDTILGFQILKRAWEGNIYGVTPGWGIIGTHVGPNAARRGVGKTLFSSTLAAAEKAGLTSIDATIANTNTEGLAYYEAMGFRTYRTPEGKICKRFDLAS